MPLTLLAAFAQSRHDVSADDLAIGEARCANERGRGLVVFAYGRGAHALAGAAVAALAV